MMIDLERKKAQRFQVLEEMYKQTNGNEMAFVNIDEICKKVGVPHDEVTSLSKYLEGEMLLEYRTMGGGVSITHDGIKEIEEAHENPDQATDHFPPINNNIIIIENMNQSQIQQGTVSSTQTYTNQSSKDVAELLGQLINTIDKEDADPNIKEATKANAEILKSQVMLPDEYKDKFLIKKSWDFLSKSSTLVSVGSFVAEHADKVLPLLGL